MPRIARDSTGENISELNPRYSELTAQYWAWKNLDADQLGLVHYRRYFAGSGDMGVLSPEDVKRSFGKAPVILPRQTNYRIETLGSHYSHTFSNTDVAVLQQVLDSSDDEYGGALEKHLSRRSGHMYNMHVMRRDILNAYCEWLYPILSQVDAKIDYSAKTPFESRCIGRLSEFLLDVWLSVNQVSYVESPIVSLEGVNWMKKGASFLAAKFLSRPYTESF
jgi:hypothetical protein